MPRRLSIALLCLLPALPLRAETYESWLSGADAKKETPPAVRFIPAGASSPHTVSIGASRIELPETPDLNLVGSLDFSTVPEADFPLTVVLRYDSLSPDQLHGIAGRDWTASGQLRRASEIGPALLVRTDHISASERSLPLVVPGLRIVRNRWGFQNFLPNPYAARAEIRSARGESLGHRLLVEAAATPGNGGAWVKAALALDDPLSDRFFHDLGISRILRETSLPSPEEAYDETEALWIDPGSLADPRLDDAWFRRRLLAGKVVAGPASAALAARLRLGEPGAENQPAGAIPILDAALLNTSLLPSAPPRHKNGGPFENAFSAPAAGQEEKSFLPPDTDLRSRGRRTGVYHLLLTGGFVLAVSLFLGLGFGLGWLKGNRRLALWIGVPAASLLYGLLGVALAPLLLGLGPRARVVEYRYSRAGWPETRVEARLSSYGFQRDRFVWRLPPGARFLPWSGVGAAETTPPSILEHRADFTLVTLQSAPGAGASTSISSWSLQADPLPCRAAGDGRVEFLRPFEEAWIWDGKNWRIAGKVAASTLVSPASLPLAGGWDFHPPTGNVHIRQASPSLSGLPARVLALFDTQWMGSLDWRGSMILLARESGVDDASLLLPAGARAVALRITVHQFQPEPVPTAPAPAPAP